MADLTEESAKLICPKCGSENVSVKRERAGTSYSGKSGGTSVRIGRVRVGSGSHGGTATNHYRTVAICKNCGCTWAPNGTDNSGGLIGKICLWIFLFPIMYKWKNIYSNFNVGHADNSPKTAP